MMKRASASNGITFTKWVGLHLSIGAVAFLFAASPVGFNSWVRISAVVFVFLYLVIRLGMNISNVLQDADKGAYRHNYARDIELSSLALFAIGAVAAITGRIESPFLAAMYLPVSLAGIFSTRKIAAAEVLLAYAISAFLFWPARTDSHAIEILLVHLVLLAVFAIFHNFALNKEAELARATLRIELEKMKHKIESEARRFRLTGSGADLEEVSKLSSYLELHSVIQRQLRLLKKMTSSKTVAVYWLDPKNKRLDMVEKISDSRQELAESIPSDRGIVSPVIGNRIPARISSIDWEKRPIPYYTRREKSNAVMITPIKYHGRVRGIVCADREGEPYSELELQMADHVAAEVVHALLNENLYQMLTKSRTDQQNVAKASQALIKPRTPADVFKESLEQLTKIGECEMAVMLLIDSDMRTLHDIRSIGVPIKNILPDPQRLPSERTLLRWVLEKQQNLIYQDLNNLPKRPAIFWKSEKFKAIRSLFISPLTSGQRLIGAVVLASKEPNRFPTDTTEILQIVINQIGVSLENALMYEAVERMAITDALTGLYNRRFFKKTFAEMLLRAERSGNRVAVVMGDIDHFKKINDTYGHPVGDMVLKEVARTLSEHVRRIDIVARYGGEEFIMALDGMGSNAAKKKIEELMDKIRALEFHTELGTFSITMSFGISSFPDDSRDAEEIINIADGALYHSKNSGRNRVTLSSDIGPTI